MDTDTKIRRVVGILCLIALAFAGFQLYQKHAERGGPSVEGPAPRFTLAKIGGEEMVSLEQFRGQVVMLDFWATWCPPCRKQMPAVQKLADDPDLEETLEILSINTDERGDDREELVARYLDENGYTFTTLIDDGSVANSYGISHLPTLVVIDPNGQLSDVQSGVHSEADLRRLVEEASKRAGNDS